MREKGQFTVKFRGIRGSYPTPSYNMLKYGGNTVCVEINVNGHLIIIDGGTGLINLGNDLTKEYIASGTDNLSREPIKAVMLFSHNHYDHIQGFPFFKPAYISTSRIHLFGAKTNGLSFEEILMKTMSANYSPVELHEISAQLLINNLRENEAIILHPDNPEPEIRRINYPDELENLTESVIISCLKCHSHPKDGVFLFKIFWNYHSIVYATDKEGYIGGDSRLASFARNTDLLIHDAQYTVDEYTSPIFNKQGFGHSTPEMAIEAAKLANVKKLALFHIDPSYDDEMVDKIEEHTKKQFNNSFIAKEGLEISIL